MITKTERVSRLLASGEAIEALRIAKGFRHLGQHKVLIQRGWDAHTNPHFARQLGRDPEALVTGAIEALLELFPPRPTIH